MTGWQLLVPRSEPQPCKQFKPINAFVLDKVRSWQDSKAPGWQGPYRMSLSVACTWWRSTPDPQDAVEAGAARPCQVHSSFHGGKVKGLGQRPTPFNGQIESFYRFPVGISREKGHSVFPFRLEHFANRELTALWYNPSGGEVAFTFSPPPLTSLAKSSPAHLLLEQAKHTNSHTEFQSLWHVLVAVRLQNAQQVPRCWAVEPKYLQRPDMG